MGASPRYLHNPWPEDGNFKGLLTAEAFRCSQGSASVGSLSEKGLAEAHHMLF